MNNRFYFLLLLWISCFTQAAWSQNDNWTNMNRTIGRINYIADPIPYPFTIDQVYPTIDAPSGLTYRDGILYVSTGNTPNRLSVFNASTAEPLWARMLEGSHGVINFVSAITDSVVVFGGQGGKGLYFLDRFTGDSLGFKAFSSLYARHGVVDGDRFYVQVDSVYCLQIPNGRVLWSNPVHISIAATPALDEEYIYICDRDSLYKFSKMDGSTVWRIGIDVNDYASFSVSDSLIFLGYQQQVNALRKEDGSTKWKYETGAGRSLLRQSYNSWSIAPDYVALKTSNAQFDSMWLTVIDRQTGMEQWSKLVNTTYTPPLIMGNEILDVSMDGILYLYDLMNGDSLYHFDLMEDAYGDEVIIADQTIFVSTGLRVVGLKSSPTSSVSNPAWKSSLKLFPNPAHTQITFQLDLPIEGRSVIELLDLQGRILEKNAIWAVTPTKQYTFHFQPQPAGLYLLRLSTSKGIVQTKLVLH